MNFGKSIFLPILFSLFLFNSVFAGDFYWVGNSGNWNDSMHWSTSSGGDGGIGIPAINDDVFFDNKSFNNQGEITVQNSATCNNFNWQVKKNVTFSSSINDNLTVNGSFVVNDNFINEFSGRIIFTSNKQQTSLNFDRLEFLGDVEFNGTGSWALKSNLYTTDSNYIYLKKGILIAENVTIYSGGINVTGSKSKTLNLKNAVVYNHDKVVFNSSNFNLINISSDLVINKNASVINLGQVQEKSITYSYGSKMVNTCGVVPFTITAFLLSNYNGFGVSCQDTCDGITYVSVTGGVGPFVIDWISYGGPSDPDTLLNACQGNVGVQVTDMGQNPPFGTQCTDQILVTNPIALAVNLIATINPTCNGDCDGAIGTSIAFGVTPYSISWIQTPDTTAIITNLCNGSYDINVMDANGCTVTDNFVISEPNPVTFQLDSTNINCFGTCTGSATVSNILGGNGTPYLYSWSNGDTINPSIVNLCPGIYSVTVSDSLGCSASDSVNITIPNQMQLDTTISPISCGGVCDGAITVTVLSGGVGPFTHNWNTAPFTTVGNVSTVSNLCFGTYTDSIVDANGCDTVLTFVITEPTPLITSTIITNVTCFSSCNGTAVTNTSGGTMPYVYLWSPGAPSGQGTDSIFNLCPGQYIVNISDNNLCSVADTVNITEPLLLVVNPSSTNITCPGFNDGTATVAPIGGTGNPAVDFTYTWTGPLCSAAPYFTQSISSLCPGTYICTVVDSFGCTAIDSVIITESQPLVLVMTSTDESCFNACDGTAAVAVTGGVTPYAFVWVPDPSPFGQGTDTIWNLCAGLYTVNITDSLGCTANGSTIVNPQTPIIDNLVWSNLTCNNVCNGTATISPTGGFGSYTVSWDGGIAIPIPIAGSNTIVGLCAGAHTAVILDANGCLLTVNFNISEPLPLTTSTLTSDVSCFGFCDGTAITTPIGGTAPYGYSWDSIPAGGPPFPFSGNPINNLCAGTYYVTVTDDSLCIVNDTITIFEPLNILPNATFTDISCNGLNDGTAISLPSGGVPGYTYLWNGSGGPYTTQSIGPLGAGQYIVTVTDTNGCIGVDTVTISNPLPLTVSAAATNASCGTVCDGIAFATPNGGTPGYSYVWNVTVGPQTTQSATGLCAGTYTVIVTDTNGCTAQDTTVINNLITIIISPSIITISCNGMCDGQATASPSGGLGPYIYQWSGNSTGPNDTLATVTGLCPGWVYVTVTDINGCASTDSAYMPIDPSVLIPNGSIDQNVSCNGACDAMVSSSPTGGTPPYTVVWNVLDTNNVCPPFAVVTVTDANNCVQSDTLIIPEPAPILPNDVVVNVNCNGDLTGSITLSPTGGTGGTYTYVWSPIGSGSSSTNLPAGPYQITITDSNGCFIDVFDTITEPPALSSIPIGIGVSCNGSCDGIAAVIVNGGAPPYTYSWSPNLQTTDTIFNLCSPFLTNSVTVIDVNGCITSEVITITEPALLLANVTGTPVNCNASCDGTSLSSPSGGTGPYSFQWSANALPNSLTNPSIINLCPDTFNIVVTDASGCTANGTYIVTAPSLLNVTLDSTNATCNGDCDGTVTATPVGGTPPYSYSWVGGSLSSPDTNTTVIGLCPGIYTVNVSDANNCSFVGSITVTEPLPITDNSVITPANCGVCDGSIVVFPSGGTPGYTHSWSNGIIVAPNPNLCAGFYTDTITDSQGCVGVFTMTISNPTGPSGVTATVNDATCNGACDGSLNVIPIGGTSPYSYNWTSIPPGGPYANDSTLTGLCAGTYNLTLTDFSNCVLASSLVIGESDSIIANPTFTNATCNGICDGTASVTPTGGTPPFSFLWLNGSTTSSVSGLCVGPISVTITDFYGCSNIVNFNITSPNLLAITTTPTDVNCNSVCDGQALAAVLGGTSPYSYQWNDPLSQITPNATGLCVGSYIVVVSDFNGCSGNDTVLISEPTLIVDNTVTTPASCGNSDGTATAAATGGIGPYTYWWPGLGTSIPNPTGLAAGTYVLEITDFNGCMQSFLVAISSTGGPTVSVNIINASCNGICDGSAAATVTSGTLPYQFLWTPGGQTTSSINGLCAGNYTVQVTDGNGCITVQLVTITDNNSITATVTTIDATCSGSCDGSGLVVPNGGTPPYTFNWLPGNYTSNAVGGLCAGNYNVTITDAILCSYVQVVTINEPSVLTVSMSGIAANCNGSCDGQATATPNGGTGPYTYLWSTNATTPTITALCAGNYSVTVTDINGCSDVANVTIGDGVAITAVINTTPATCGLCDGSITVIGGGGSGGPYTYNWSPGGQTTSTINNLCPGTYIVDISDNVLCTQQFNILISNLNGPTLTTQADSTSCFGSCDGLAWTTVVAGNPNYIFQWDDPLLQVNDSATSLCAGLYNIIVQDALGCIAVDSVTVLEPQQIFANFTFTNPSCPGVCDGTVTTSPVGGIGTYSYSWNTLPVQTTPTATNLCAGTYAVTITDGNGCSMIDSITIADPTPVSISISSTSVTCNGDCDGTALANASGGTPSYSYSWNTLPPQLNSIAAGLCSGTYIVTVTDNNGCIAMDSIQLIDPPLLSTTSTPTPATCNGLCDGSISTIPSGGMAPYTYIWSNGATTPTITNLCPGSFNVIVVDANNCTVYDTILLVAPVILNDSTLVNGPSCGICDGSATSTPFGGVGPFDFVWTNLVAPIYSFTDLNTASSTAVGLCAGTYNLQITDLGSGCIDNYTIIVNSVTGPVLNLTATDETCPNACDGSVSVNPSGGNPPYSYSWTPVLPPNDTNQTVINLCSGLYTVTVTDSINCISADTISINAVGLNLTLTSVVPETCFGDCDGMATVFAANGVSPYSYLWLPTLPIQITPTASNLCVGNYMVTVTDNSNCSDSISTSITGPTILTVTASVNTPISCNGNCDGIAIASTLGGTPNYSYTWNTTPVQNTQIATGLCVGTYIVTVIDSNGCSAIDTIVINEPTPILANEVIVTPACNVCDGSITLSPNGGNNPYTFLWSTPTSPPLPQPVTSSITNLCAGSYSVIITDVTGCSANFNFPLSNTNAPDPNTTVTDISCNGMCDGQISSSPLGGIPPYTYLWNPSGSTPIISNLCPGLYQLNVTDSVGCIGVSMDSITEPNPLFANLDSSNVTCYGLCDGWAVSNPYGGTAPYSYNWMPGSLILDSITNLCAGTYTVSVTDSNNCTVIDSVIIMQPAQIITTDIITPTSCVTSCDGSVTVNPSGGSLSYTFEWNGSGLPGFSTETGLCFGLNYVVITDLNGCSITDSINIGATDTIIANAGNDTIICMGESANLIGIPTGNFTSVEWFELPGMIPLGTTNSILVNPAVTGVVCYAYQVNGGCVNTDTVCITVDPLPSANAGPDVTIFENTSTVLNASGGGTYSWNPVTGLSDSTISNPIATPEITTTYFVTVTSLGGCVAVDSVVVTVLPTIKFPDGISPNGDGQNDVWIIDFIEEYPNNVVEIYNRWGELLFHADGYQQDWDGTYNGKELPIGTYYYIIDLHDELIKPYTGPLTILR